MSNVHVLNHPLAKTYLATLRDKNSAADVFRAQAKRLAYMLALEITNDIKVKPQTIKTPIKKTEESVLDESIALVPILRAGLGMVEPFTDFLPDAKVYCYGAYRNEETHQPVPYYNKLDEYEMVDTAYVLDPMLATGGSAIITIDALKEWGVQRIKFAGLIGAPEGVEALHKAHADVEIYLAALDEGLNENAYIVPGLGDAGDRIFNS
ncbi:MAG: uracil phosphoribosyltransferase [Pseudomonadota bacterium]